MRKTQKNILTMITAMLFIFNLGNLAHGTNPDKPVKEAASQFVRLEQMSSGQAKLAVFSEIPLERGANVQRVVVMVHGTQRNAADYFGTTSSIARKAGISTDNTLIVAPQFLARADADRYLLPPGTLVWSSNGWKDGEDTLSNPVKNGANSSFAALDDLFLLMANKSLYPNLQQIVLAGHSAGAQFVQRYAVMNSVEESLGAKGISLRYVIANPSSYLYFDARRPTASGGFAPANTVTCPNVNQYKYGLQGRIPYGRDVKSATLVNRYLERDVVYMLGTADHKANDPSMDRTCPAEAEGANRLARGENYIRYLQQLTTGGVITHRLNFISGVGHSASGMYGSACGRRALFSNPCATQRLSSSKQ